MKKLIYIVPFLLLLFGCTEYSSNDEKSDFEEKPADKKEESWTPGDEKTDFEEETSEQYGTIYFFNGSGYEISIHSDAFSGPVVAELSSGEAKSVSVRASNNHGIGSVFAIGFRTKIMDDAYLSCGEIYAYGIDPNMQFTLNIEAGKDYTLQIPRPSDLVYETAFIQILNVSSNSFELTKNSMSHKQAGNGVLPVDVGEIGVYEIPASASGTAFEGYKVKSVFKNYDIPAFDAVYSHVYTFSFNGSSVVKTGDTRINGNYVIDNIGSDEGEKSDNSDETSEKKPNISEPDYYTVFFESNNEKYIEPYTVQRGKEITIAPEVQKDGVAFAGWYLDKDFKQRVEFPYMLDSDAVLYAEWKSPPEFVPFTGIRISSSCVEIQITPSDDKYFDCYRIVCYKYSASRVARVASRNPPLKELFLDVKTKDYSYKINGPEGSYLINLYVIDTFAQQSKVFAATF